MSTERARIVFLAADRFSTLGGEIAAALPKERFELHAVCERVTLDRVRRVTPGRVLRKVAGIVKSRVTRVVGGAPAASPALCDVPGVVMHEVSRMGDAKCLALLAEIAPRASADTGECGILRENLLEAAGPVLNVHCGLPYTRGFNAIEWTAWFGLPFRPAVHRIEAGLDTGAVLHDAVLPRTDGAGVAELRRAFDAHRAPLFVAAIERLTAEGDGAFTPQPAETGRTFFAMHRDLRDVLEETLADGTAPGAWVESIDAPRCRDVALSVL